MIDIRDGKIVRWVDYWDGRHFGTELAAKMRTPSDKVPTDFSSDAVYEDMTLRTQILGRLTIER